jgi:hypothetical protein
MTFDWTVSVASAIQFIFLMAGLLTGLWRWSTRMSAMDVKLDYLQKELSRLTDVAAKQVAHDERLRSIEQRIENLRCFQGGPC